MKKKRAPMNLRLRFIVRVRFIKVHEQRSFARVFETSTRLITVLSYRSKVELYVEMDLVVEQRRSRWWTLLVVGDPTSNAISQYRTAATFSTGGVFSSIKISNRLYRGR